MKQLTPRAFFNYVAFGISAMFSPYVAAAIFIVLIVYRYAQDLTQFLPWMLAFFAFAIVLPGFYILWLLEAKKISDIHMTNANDRKIPLLVAAASSVVGVVVLYFLHAVRPVFVISVVYAINSLALAIVTQKWKISVHTGTYATIATVATVIFGWQFAWLYLVLIPLGWARIFRKRHTFLQATTGALMTTFLTLLTLWVFGYIR